jgi:hypothetical protein
MRLDELKMWYAGWRNSWVKKNELKMDEEYMFISSVAYKDWRIEEELRKCWNDLNDFTYT